VIVQGTSIELDVARARGIRDELAAAQAEIARLREEPGIRRASRLGFHSWYHLVQVRANCG
jgi:hypothetical protein